MAPEQLAGKEVTERSDIYSLGLVLYEVFTGKRAFSADSLAELLRSRNAGTVSRPSSFIKDMDPLVERVIMHCVEADPALRPASALAVAAALPGGDPLAIALAAGETPSPQMVAADGQIEGMKPRTALLCLAACVIGILATVVLIAQYNIFSSMSLDMSPDVLTQKARDIVTELATTQRLWIVWPISTLTTMRPAGSSRMKNIRIGKSSSANRHSFFASFSVRARDTWSRLI